MAFQTLVWICSNRNGVAGGIRHRCFEIGSGISIEQGAVIYPEMDGPLAVTVSHLAGRFLQRPRGLLECFVRSCSRRSIRRTARLTLQLSRSPRSRTSTAAARFGSTDQLESAAKWRVNVL